MKRLLLGASGAILALAALPAAAQTASEPQPGHSASSLDDVVVTAQRRAQNSQDVGIALSVIGGEELDEKGVNVVNDIENVVPNLEVDSQFGSGQPSFRIRG
ncbi:MAG: TonB-dependent receptor, partial [Brevundimonas sp.]|nr:TonB-dependent receptor [Brevundimonas sp.]